MKKYLFWPSLSLNLVLLLFLFVINMSHNFIDEDSTYVDNIRLEDTKMLEALLVGRISKKETLNILESKFSEEDFFDKPQDNGVGVGSLFLVFDDKEILSKIETHDFLSGP